MSVVEHHSVEPGLIPALARHLEHLKDNPDGVELFELIERALDHCREKNYINASCIVYLHARLQEFTKTRKRTPAVRIRARLIQQYLAMYLPRLGKKAASANTTADAKSISLRAAPVEGAAARGESRWKHDAAIPEVTAPAPFDSQGTIQNQGEHAPLKTNDVENLLRERETLSRRLNDANAYLKMIEAEREQLRTELNKLRRSARTNEKSLKKLGLPARHVLLRQIQAEIERVNRHGNPLALALIDVDNLEKLNRELGQDVTKAVIDHYASEILRNFRSYDLVARYDKDEFAVLLPNTDKAEAARALEKIRKRASESHFSHKGRRHPLPGFGGVLTFYSPGEEPNQMLRRADEALVNLKLRGESRLVVV